jgi:hypothetical protein
MDYLRQSTAATITIGQFVNATSGSTPLLSVVLAGTSAGLLKSNSQTSVSLGGRNWQHIDAGFYQMGLLSTDVDVTGPLFVFLSGATAGSNSFLGVWKEFHVVSANYYDSIHGDVLQQVNSTQFGGTTISSTGGVTVIDKTGFGISSISSAATLATGVTVTRNSDKGGTTVSSLTDKSGITVGWIASGATLTDKSGITVGWIYSSATLATGVTVTRNSDKGGTTVSSLTDKSGITVGWIASGATLTDKSGITVGWIYSSATLATGVIVSTLQDKSGITVGLIPSTVTLPTSVTVGSIVSSATLAAGVTVGTNQDKTGYYLAPDQSSVTLGWLLSGVTVTRNMDKSGTTISSNLDKTDYYLAPDQSSVSIGYVLSEVTSTVGSISSGVTVSRIESGVTLATSVTASIGTVVVSRIDSGATLATGVTVGTSLDKTGYSLASDQSSVTVGTVASGVTVARIESGATLATGVTTSIASVTVAQINSDVTLATGVTTATNLDKIGYYLALDQSSATIGYVLNNVTTTVGTITSGVTVSRIESSVTLATSVTASIGQVVVSRIDSGATLATGVTVGTNLDKTGYYLALDQSSVTVGYVLNDVSTTISSGVTVTRIDSGATLATGVTVGSNLDKTGYYLFPDQSSVSFGWLLSGATVTRNLDKGGTTVSSVLDKTGYSLASNQSAVSIGVVVSGVTVGRIDSGATLATNVTASIGTVTVSRIDSGATLATGVTVGTNLDKGGTTVSSVLDKTGYSLSADQSSVSVGYVLNSVTSTVGAISSGVTVSRIESAVTLATGVTVGTNADKTGYSLAYDQSSVSVGYVLSEVTASGGLADWTPAEKAQIREALGITGTTEATADGQLQFVYHIEGGRWKIDTTTNEMVFYKANNVSEIARFSLLDKNGFASYLNPYERTRS